VSASDKRYQAVIQLGTTTDTYDGDGRVLATTSVDISEKQFNDVLQSFVGQIEQVPPPYSSVKVKGRHAYDMARNGEEVDLEARTINVYNLDLLEWAPPEAVIDVYCSSGTYVRSLAHDLGEKLGCGAHLIGLRRTKSGRFTLRDAVPLRKLREAFENDTWENYIIPAAEALSDWPAIELSAEQLDIVRHGRRIPAEIGAGKMARAISEEGELIGLLELDPETQEWQPKKVFTS
jgi:tRNA pseudouridine55 synthase